MWCSHAQGPRPDSLLTPMVAGRYRATCRILQAFLLTLRVPAVAWKGPETMLVLSFTKAPLGSQGPERTAMGLDLNLSYVLLWGIKCSRTLS